MSLTDQLSPLEKETLKSNAEKHIGELKIRLAADVVDYERRIQQAKDTIPQLAATDIKKLDPDSEELSNLIARINIYEKDIEELTTIQSSPYFVKLDIVWKDTAKAETIYISKYSHKDANIYSWITPIATLRFADLGLAGYSRPGGTYRGGDISAKDTFIITNAEIVFMTHSSKQYPRQVVFQKHIAERRQFLLPEIVAELDKLQDQIIRSDPHGSFLISGPAGSGKTTLALHRVAYLVLTPEFKEFFQPNNIIVFVADDSATRYFGKLLPELGINGVQITTFLDWATMIANSRYRPTRVPNRFKPAHMSTVLEHITAHNPLPGVHPRLVLDEYRRIKQEFVSPLQIKEGHQKPVYPALFSHYENALTGVDSNLAAGFRKYQRFLADNHYLDEVDLTILLLSLEQPVKPFAHIVIDEVQNWFAQQLEVISGFANRVYASVTYIGDIRQKTKVFTINSWNEIGEDWDAHPGQKVELLKVYRNTQQILQYLQAKSYAVEVPAGARQGTSVNESTLPIDIQARQGILQNLINEIIAQHGKVQVGIMAKYQTSLEGLEFLGHDSDYIHVRTIEEAQGLEFHTAIVIDVQDLQQEKDSYIDQLGYISGLEHFAQDRHLFYVAATRAKEQLFVYTTA